MRSLAGRRGQGKPRLTPLVVDGELIKRVQSDRFFKYFQVFGLGLIKLMGILVCLHVAFSYIENISVISTGERRLRTND
jgi:hypothetical protein